jgi:hypothetical protein
MPIGQLIGQLCPADEAAEDADDATVVSRDEGRNAHVVAVECLLTHALAKRRKADAHFVKL